MKQNWWKLIVVAALAVVVAMVLATKDRAPDAQTRAAKRPGVNDRAAGRAPRQTAETQAEETVARSAATAEADKANTKTPADKPTTGDRVVRAAKGAPAATSAPKPKPKPTLKAKPASTRLPKLVDLGATKCIPCKMMAPILEELKKDYKGRLAVVFIDVWETPGAGEKYGIQRIPTQIFYDGNGKEFFRHEGFFPKEDILKTFEEKGIKL